MVWVIATICSIWTGECMDRVVVHGDFAEVSITSCLTGPPQLAEWMKEYPAYRLAKWKCSIGKPPKDT